MISDAEWEARRTLIRKFRTRLLERLAPIERRMKEITDDYGRLRRSISFGVSDEEEDRRQEVAQREEYARLTTQKEDVNQMWGLVIEVFGKDLVDHAVEEGEKRIGDLPYVEPLRTLQDVRTSTQQVEWKGATDPIQSLRDERRG